MAANSSDLRQTDTRQSPWFATGAAIVGSSGSALLDDAVLEFYETMEFIPAGTNDQAVDVTVSVPVLFKLAF